MKKLGLTMILAALNANSAEVNHEVKSFSQLDALRSENALLEIQVKNNAVLDALAKNADLKQRLLGGNVETMPSQGNVTSKPQNNIDYSAKVESVSGMGANNTAKINFGNGSNVMVKVGQKVQGLGVVKKITRNEVLCAIGKETYSVPFVQENTSTGFENAQDSNQHTVPGLGGN